MPGGKFAKFARLVAGNWSVAITGNKREQQNINKNEKSSLQSTNHNKICTI